MKNFTEPPEDIYEDHLDMKESSFALAEISFQEF